SKADEQRTWRVRKAQDIKELKDRLIALKKKTAIEKTKVEQASSDLKAQKASLNLAFVTMAATSERLKMQSKAVKQLCRLFPMRRVIKEGEKKGDYSGPYDSICGARLPRGLDPHSVPSEELSASLGYMLQLVNIAVRILSAPALHVSGFGIYPLFIPRRNVCTGGEENSMTGSGSGNFGVDSVDSVKKPSLDSKRSNSFNFSATSSHSTERHQDLQRGISLLKTSVIAITTYYYNSLGLDVPSNLSTFEAFTKLLHMLSSSKALRAALESNIASRSAEQAQQLNRSIWKASSAISSDSSIMDSMHTIIMPSSLDNLLLNSNGSFLYTGQAARHGGVPDSIFDGWDLVEREVLPPPPSQVEDVAQWERAINRTNIDPRNRSTYTIGVSPSRGVPSTPPQNRAPGVPPPLPSRLLHALARELPASPAMSSLRAMSALLHIYSSSAVAAGRGVNRMRLATQLGGSFRVPLKGPSAFVLDEVSNAAGSARRTASTRAASWDSEKSPYETLVYGLEIRGEANAWSLCGMWIEELDRDADEETIKTAYRRLAKFYHPDVYDGKGTLEEGETAEARFIKIQAAYELLIDDERRKSYDREHHVNPMKNHVTINQASQAWMEWVMKKRKAFDKRGDMAVAAWAEQQHREMTLRARRLSRSKVDPEEERRLFAKEKKASMDFYSTTLKRHTLVLRKRDIMRKKAEEDKNSEISRLLAAEGLELDIDEDDNKTFLK
ncbi:hypothetical protein EJB05_52065, partial [Eragrostis curvula]